MWYATSDLAKVRHYDNVVDAPCREWRFPLIVGQTWSSTCTLRPMSGGEAFSYSGTWTVAREEDVTVPAGTYHALVVQENDTDGASTTTWWSPDACWWVQMEARAPDGSLVERLRLAQPCAPLASPTPASPTGTPATTTTVSSTPTATTSETSPPAEGNATDREGKPTPSAPFVGVLAALAAVALLARSKRS